MATLNLKHKRITLDVSASLIKNTDTGEKKWRHRFLSKKEPVKIGRQKFIDYPYNEFKSIDKFAEFIERMIKRKEAKIREKC